MSDEKVLLGILDLTEAKRLRGELESKGVELELVSNPETCADGKCGPGGGTKVEIYARDEDVKTFQQFISGERSRMLEGLGVRPELLEQVYDTEKGTAVCPACGTEFSTQAAECPDCGLGFAGP